MAPARLRIYTVNSIRIAYSVNKPNGRNDCVTTKSRPTHSAKGTDLRDRLLDEAVRLLEREGLEALTLRGTARAAGVSHMAPYRHFADKDALLAAVAETGFRQLSTEMEHGEAEAATAQERLRAIGTAYVRFARLHPQLYRLMFGPAKPDKTRFPELAEASRATFARCSAAVAERAAPKGIVDDEAREALTLATWSLAHGLSSLLIDGRLAPPRNEEQEDRLIAQVMQLFGRIFRP